MNERAATPSGRSRLLVVDDHEVVRQGIVARWPDRDAASRSWRRPGRSRRPSRWPSGFRPDLVVMDVRLPDAAASRPAATSAAEHPETRVVMLTSYPDEDVVMLGDRGRRQRLPAQAAPRPRAASPRSRRSAAASRCSTRPSPRRSSSASGGSPRRRTTRSSRCSRRRSAHPRPGRGGQDEQGDRRRGLPVGQDRQELRELDPVQAQPPAARPGRRVRREAQALGRDPAGAQGRPLPVSWDLPARRGPRRGRHG